MEIDPASRKTPIMRLPLLMSALLLASACRTDLKPDDTAGTGGGTTGELCTWYADGDGDGFGDADAPLEGDCAGPPAGYVEDASDCDDSDVSINPDALEVCNELDDDCDGEVDEDATDAGTWYADADGDSYGDGAVETTRCGQPSGYVDDATDCDDDDA